jgi:hypothetical protein
MRDCVDFRVEMLNPQDRRFCQGLEWNLSRPHERDLAVRILAADEKRIAECEIAVVHRSLGG